MQLTESQTEALKQFRNLVQDVVPAPNDDSWYLIKWLKARNFNVKEAEVMLRKHLNWRKENGIDDLMETFKPPEVMEKYFPYGHIGFDKVGNQVLLVRPSKFDPYGAFESCNRCDLVNFGIWVLEKYTKSVLERTKKADKPLAQMYLILDTEDFQIKHLFFKPGVELILEFLKIVTDNYPELLKKSVMINCNSFYLTLYKALKFVIPEKTREKIAAFGREGWQSVLLDDVEAQYIPECYGGTLTDGSGDPRCPNLVNLGGEIPLEYYRSNRIKTLVDHGNVTELNVSNRCKVQVDLPPVEAGSIVKWLVCTEYSNVEFEILHEDEYGNQIAIVGGSISSRESIKESEFTCSRPGKCILRFDNTDSVFRSKTVYYKVEVS